MNYERIYNSEAIRSKIVENFKHKNREMIILLGLVTAVAAVVSCQPKTRKLDMNTMTQQDQAKKIQEESTMAKTCDRPLTTEEFPKELLENAINIEDEIANKDIEHLDCQGHLFWKGHGPEKQFRRQIEISSPLNEENLKVNFIQMENIRTCTIQRITPADDTIFEGKEIKNADGSNTQIRINKTVANSKGAIKLMVTDSILNSDANFMNIHEGSNLIRIQYFGKCTKYREKIEEKYDDAYNCETAEVIKTKDVYIKVKINRPDVNGVSQTVFCFNGQKDIPKENK
jgi:hypothetical protein